MQIIFSTSYLSAVETICLIERSNSDFMILTSNPFLFKFYCELYGYDKILLIGLQTGGMSLLRKISCHLSARRNAENIWKDSLSQYFGVDVYFSCTSFCESEALLINKLSKNNKIYYHPIIDVSNNTIDDSLLSLLKIKMKEVIYSIPLISTKSLGLSYHSLREEYFKGLNFKDYTVKYSYKAIHHAASKVCNLSGGQKILILCGGICDTFCSHNEYTYKMDALIKELVMVYGYQAVHVKTHPLLNDLYSEEGKIYEVPSYVPANLILSQYDIIIGYGSSVLFESELLGVLSIALLNYINPIDSSNKNDFIKYLEINSSGGIQYPNSLKDIMMLISSTIVKK